MGLDHQSTQNGLCGDGGSCRCAAKLPSFLMMTKTTIVLDQKQNYKSFLQISNVGFQSFKIFVSCTQFACSQIWICYLWPTHTDRQTDTLGRQVHFWQFLDRNLIGIFLSLFSRLTKAVAITDLHSHGIALL